jgi:PAS domain S-box-containing protein
MRGSLLDTERRNQAATGTLRVLLVDDASPQHADVRATLETDERFVLHELSSPDAVRETVAQESFDVVLSDLVRGDALRVLEDCRRAAPHTPVVILTSRGNEFWAAESIKRGAADYLSTHQPEYLRLVAECLLAVHTRAAANGNGHARHAEEHSQNGHASNGHNGHENGHTQDGNGHVQNGHSPNGHAAAPAAIPEDDLQVYCRILSALPVHLAMLDQQGMIRTVNDAWRKYSLGSLYQNHEHLEGTDYLAVCDQGVEQGIEHAQAIADGLRRVLVGKCSTFAVEYPFQIDGVQRWFKMAASPLRDDKHQGAMIAHVDITDRKQAELERDQLFEQSLSLLCIGGFDGYMRRWSRSVQVLGYKPNELMKLSLWSLLHPEDRELASVMGDQLRAGEMVSTTEMRVRSKDGSYRWILWDAVPCLEQDLFFATGQDITDRKEIEQQLRESHQRFQLIAGATREAIWDWDLRENRLWQNEAYLEVFGTFNRDTETPVEWWRRRIHPDDLERVLAVIPRVSTDGQQKWVLEYRLQRADHSYAYVYDRGFVIFDEQQRPVRMVGSIIDVTALKTTEEKLRESEERFRLAAKATRDAIWDWDRERSYIWRSKGFQNLFGYTSDQITPDLAWWTDRIHPDDRERVMSQLPDMESNKSQQCSFEYRFKRADGTYADVIDRGFVMLSAEGRALRMVGSIMDVSERRRAETLAHMHQAELAHRSRISTMGEIATGIAHELNQPLTAISNYAESCSRAIAARGAAGASDAVSNRGADADAKLLTWIDKISNNTHRAAEMIRRLRSFTRKSEPTRSTIEASELVSETIELIEAETRLKSFRVRWQPQSNLWVRVDRIQIEQVLVNLLRNAYEAMAGNVGDQRRVTIGLARRADKVEISVEDVGEGIAAENQERVFDAFFTSKPNGVGIGLAISRSIVEDHGGRLWVEPNPERGVTFRFTLPLSGAGE